MLSTCSGFLTRYVKPLFIAVTGILVMTLSFYFASRFTLHTTHAQIMLVLYLRGFGMGLTFAPLNDFSLMNLSQCDMASAAGISNSIKQLSGSVSIALLTVILTGRTAFHSAQGGLSSAESYVAGISDDFLFVTFVSLPRHCPSCGCCARAARRLRLRAKERAPDGFAFIALNPYFCPGESSFPGGF